MNHGKPLVLFLVTLSVLFLQLGCNDVPKSTSEQNPILTNDPLLKDVSAAIAKDPSNASLYFERGNLLARMKEDTLALSDLKKAANLDTTKAAYYSAVGDFLFERKDLTGAIEWIQKAIIKNPTDPKAHLKIAKLFLYLAQHENAFKELNIVLRKDVYNPEAYFLKGMVYKDMKDTPRAISNFQTTLQVAPDYKDAVLQLGLLYSAKKDSIALKYMDNALKIDSNDVFPIFARGVYFQNKKDYVQAKREYRRCIIRNSRYIDAYFNLGYIYMQEDSLEKAFHEYDLVTKLDPLNPTGYFNRGLCNEIMSKSQEAILDYRKALVLDSSYESPKKALKRLSTSTSKSK